MHDPVAFLVFTIPPIPIPIPIPILIQIPIPIPIPIPIQTQISIPTSNAFMDAPSCLLGVAFVA